MSYCYRLGKRNTDIGMDSFAPNTIRISSHPIPISPYETKKVEMFRKSEYVDILKKKREAFVMDLFSKDMEGLSKKMKESAEKMEACNQTHLFPVADWLDLPKMEKILQDYFRDLGYTVVSQIEEKENKKTVKITLS